MSLEFFLACGLRSRLPGSLESLTEPAFTHGAGVLASPPSPQEQTEYLTGTPPFDASERADQSCSPAQDDALCCVVLGSGKILGDFKLIAGPKYTVSVVLVGAMAAGLRSIAKVVESPPAPTVRAPVPDPYSPFSTRRDNP
jgi:hypothetical protein